MKKTTTSVLVILFCLYFADIYAQKKPLLPECPVNSVSPNELSVGSGAGQVYPSISVSTLNDCTNYLIGNSYYWMSYVKNGLTVSVSVTNNSGYTPRSGCLNIGTHCVFVVQGCSLRPGVAGSISGESSVCQGQTGVTYSVPTIANATGYVWSLPSGASITSGANTNQITVIFNTSASSGNITVYGTNSCNVGNGRVSPNFPVTVNPLPVAPVGAISSKMSVCQNKGGTMILTAIGGSGTTLRWRSGNCINGQYLGTGNNLEVPVPLTYTTTYYARWETSCGNSTCASVTVTVIPAPYVWITQSPNPGGIGLPIGLDAHAQNGGGYYPTYSWAGPNGWSSDDSDPIVYYYIGNATGPYYLNYTSSDGCESNQAEYWLNINFGLRSPSMDTLNTENKNEFDLNDLAIYPNPTTGEVNISSNQFDDLEVIIYNSMGKPLFNGFNVSTINMSRYVSGTYLITLKFNGKEITHIINLKK